MYNYALRNAWTILATIYKICGAQCFIICPYNLIAIIVAFSLLAKLITHLLQAPFICFLFIILYCTQYFTSLFFAFPCSCCGDNSHATEHLGPLPEYTLSELATTLLSLHMHTWIHKTSMQTDLRNTSIINFFIDFFGNNFFHNFEKVLLQFTNLCI